MTELEQFYENQPSELREVYLALRQIILKQHENITPEWKYKLPFFYYKGKMLCYLWYHKSFKMPYISIMDANLLRDERLLMEDRKRAGILLIDPNEDLQIDVIEEILQNTLELFRKGIIKTPKK